MMMKLPRRLGAITTVWCVVFLVLSTQIVGLAVAQTGAQSTQAEAQVRIDLFRGLANVFLAAWIRSHAGLTSKAIARTFTARTAGDR